VLGIRNIGDYVKCRSRSQNKEPLAGPEGGEKGGDGGGGITIQNAGNAMIKVFTHDDDLP